MQDQDLDQQITQELGVDNKKSRSLFQQSNKLRLDICSFLSGCELFNKIALMSKKIRSQLPNDGLLDQNKVITTKKLNTEVIKDFKIDTAYYAV